MEDINSLDIYTDEMRKSMQDKLFFMDFLCDVDNLVDFGCADGTLLDFVHNMNNHINLYGIDMNMEMIERARKRVPTAEFICGTHPYIDVTFDYSKSALNLSSVLHELYSYSSESEIENFWKYIKYSGFKYIFIRDMISNLKNEKASRYDIKCVARNHKYNDKLADFVNTWGDITIQKNLVHFLLKYRYDINWNREVKENYIPLSSIDIKRLIGYDYDVVYMDEYTLPFIKEQVKKDFNINLNDVTHIKMILRVKE